MSPVFSVGEAVVVTDSIEDHYNGMNGIVVEEIFRNYISDYVYVVKVEDGYQIEFMADELTASDDIE